MVGGTFLVLFGGWSAIYAYAAFAPAMAASLGVTEATLCLVYAVAGGSCFLIGAIAGPLADRIGARLPALAGIALIVTGLLLAAESHSLAMMTLTYGLMVGTGVGLAYIPAMAAVQCCFTARRGLASGIAATGIAVATLLVPVVAALFAPIGDWRAQMRVLALMVLVLGLAGAPLLPGSIVHGLSTEGPQLEAVRRSPAFLRLYVAVLLVSIPVSLPFAWLPRAATLAGLSQEEGLALLSVVGIGSMFGRVLLSHVADRIGRGATLLLSCAGIGLAMLVWASAGNGALIPFALVFGFFQGAFVALSPAVAVDLFGRRSAAGTSGLLLTGRGLAVLVVIPGVVQASALWGEALAITLAGLCGLMGCALLHSAMARAGMGARPFRQAGRHGGDDAECAARTWRGAMAFAAIKPVSRAARGHDVTVTTGGTPG